jgi:hypothetical protein
MADEPRLDQAMTYLDEARTFESFGEAVITMLSSIVIFVGASLMAAGEATVNVFVSWLDAFGVGGTAWIYAFTRDPAGYIGASFEAGEMSMLEGIWSQLGPFLPWVATIVAVGVVFIITWYLDRRDSDVPGAGVDLPFIGNDEDGDVSDEVD